MVLLPIILPLIAILFAGYYNTRKKYSTIMNSAIVLMTINTIVSWMIALGIIPSSSPLAFDWINMIDLTISFGVYWLPIPSYISAIVNTVFVAILLFVRQDSLVKNDDTRTPAFLCSMLMFLEILLASPHVGQIIFGWQGVVFSAFVLLGGVSGQVKDSKKASIFLLAVNLVGVVLFIVGVQVGNVLGAVDATDLINVQFTVAGLAFNVRDAILVVFVAAVSVPMGILPFNTWLDKAFNQSSSVAGFIFGTFLLVGSYALFHILLVMDVSQSVRVGIALYAMLNMIVSSMVALSHRNVGQSVSYIYSAVSSTVLFAFAIGTIEYALLFSVVQFIGIVGLSLTTGATVTALSGERDMTKMGGLAQRLPGIYFMFFVIVLSLVSIPPFSGFFAHMWVLENLSIESTGMFWILFSVMMLGQLALSNVFGRMWAMIFYGTEHVDDRVSAHIEDSNILTLFSLAMLSIMLLVVGWMAQHTFFASDDVVGTDTMHVSGAIKVFVPLIVTISGLIYGFRKVVKNQNNLEALYQENDIWQNNLYIKDGLETLLLVPLNYICKAIDVIERPALGIVFSRAVGGISFRITATMDVIFRAPVIVSVLVSLLMICVMVVLYVLKIEVL